MRKLTVRPDLELSSAQVFGEVPILREWRVRNKVNGSVVQNTAGQITAIEKIPCEFCILPIFSLCSSLTTYIVCAEHVLSLLQSTLYENVIHRLPFGS